MKKYLLYSIYLLAFVLSALPVAANDYLKIYFKDGHTERHFMHLVESISTTKYDLEGNLHDDYQMQQIVMSDTTYSYYLTDIDSMSFKKVYEEQLKNEVESALTRVEPLFSQSPTIEDMLTHIDEIKEIEGVEDVWREDRGIVVQFRDWYSLYIAYPLIPEKTESRLTNIANSLETISRMRPVPLAKDGLPIKVVIAFQMIDDTRFDEEKEEMKALKRRFSALGFDVHFVPDEETGEVFDTDFYKRRMFDYNIVIIDTHGSYFCGKHGLFTGERYELWEGLFLALEPFDMDEIRFDFCHTIYKGEEKESNAMFKEVTEDFIKKSKYKFTGGGPHIVFIGACQTFKGDETLIREHGGVKEKRKGSSAVADILFDKGADVVLGYNNYAGYSSWAASSFFTYMLNGASEEAALHRLAPGYRDEPTQYKAALIDFINPNSEYNNPKSYFFYDNHTMSKTKQEVVDEINNKGKIDLQGETTLGNIESSGITCGFRWGTEPNVETQQDCQEIKSKNVYNSETEFGKVSFTAEINPGVGPERTIYYRAFTYDGIYYNWGEERNFPFGKLVDLELSSGSFCIYNGESTTIDITGNGIYDIFKGNEKVTKVTLDGEKLIIEAIGAGESTIIVTDKKTGQTAPLKVTVWARLSIAIIGNIDLEVGDKTNVRIMSGNNDYTLDSDYPKVATPTLIGEFVSVEALSAGKATITVTDNKTGQTASFTVTVNDSTPIDIPAETIDLGLPSGTLWASYNIGATKPEEYGSYFAWGETEQKEKCGWYNYTHCNGSENTCFNLGSDISGTKYDVAHTKWGGEWCLPTLDQVKELINKCSSTWTTVNGVNGLLFTGPNGKTIFFPAAGYLGGEVLNTGSYGYYWSGGQDPKNAERAYNLAVYNGTPNWLNNYRFAGFSVRPVINGTPSYADLVLSTYDPININVNAGLTFLIVSGSGTYAVESSNEAVATVTLRGNYVDVSGVAAGTATITVIDVMSGQRKSREVTVIDNTPLPGTPAEAIDLGLPSGTLWASYNIGASKPEEYGSYLAWGETEEKDFYNENTYLYKETDIGTNIAGTIYDVAHILWGGSWQMPNKRLLQELFKCCSFEWITVNGVKGGKLTGPNGNSIFMPAGEWKVGYGSNGTQYGAYWSSEQGKGWRFYMGTNDLFSCSTYIGLLVRPVIPGKTGDIPAQAIDLGLPSGTKWASYNVGATAPDDHGGYYAWGETEEKEVYELKNYIHCDGDDKTYHNIGENIIGTEYDVATVRWGSSWHMPTKEQFEELINNCSVVYGKTQNGVYGIQYTGPNGNKIFLPATGHKIGNTYYQYRGGRYWTGQLVKWDDYVSDSMCDILSFERNTQGLNVDNDYGLRYMGLSVRPVTNE